MPRPVNGIDICEALVFQDSSYTIASRNSSPLKFFFLVFALSIPFWLIGAVTNGSYYRAGGVDALMFVCPTIAASILVHRETGTGGVIELLKKSFDYKRINGKVWYAPVLLLMPGVMLLSYGVMRLTGTHVPPPKISFLPTFALCIIFFISALGEELGWSGYAIDPMQRRWSSLQASIVLGLVWAIWHFIPLVHAHRLPEWIAWWSLGTVAARVIIVWFYNNTGKSVFAATLFHAMLDVTWQLFPIHGSFYDPRITGVITAIVAAIVTIAWVPQTLPPYDNT